MLREKFHYIYAVLHHPDYRERYAANLRRELPRIPFATSIPCHPEAAESLAKRATPNEGPMQFAGGTVAADESIGPSARKERGPQDDKDVFRAQLQSCHKTAEKYNLVIPSEARNPLSHPPPLLPRCKLTRKSRHKTIQHKSKICVNGDIHTNTVFSLLKRGIVGSWHRISAKHLSDYLDEMTWRFNNRKNPVFSATRCGSSWSRAVTKQRDRTPAVTWKSGA